MRSTYSHQTLPAGVSCQLNTKDTARAEVDCLESFCTRHAEQLRAAGIRRVTFLIIKPVILL
ncbi:unnamed protein product [Protopolystoma xenopodis]|uniref:Uncharacterized protein n=1 Tax=Protopolystoma xenopodis TaxID=117903 RepID=A0A448WV13_9PLAT|nr:unnamed protein product [Protopolystoma xenopodis]